MSDNTPGFHNSAQHIFVQPGDDMSINGVIVYEKSGVQLMALPEQGLEVTLQTMYGNELYKHMLKSLKGNMGNRSDSSRKIDYNQPRR